MEQPAIVEQQATVEQTVGAGLVAGLGTATAAVLLPRGAEEYCALGW